jgi:hypothetical protein
MIGVGLDLSLRNYASGVSYLKLGRVIDLSTPFNELTFTLADRSGEGNDATLYTGRFISTDGGTDRGINADLSEYPLTDSGTLPSVRVTGWVKPVGTEAAFTFNTGWGFTLSGLTAGVWQSVDFTDSKDFGTLGIFRVGYNEDAGAATACSYSDIRVMDNNANDALIARCQLTESADGDLHGYPALDSSGNGYHGQHIGCAGGTGEADILQTAGQNWNKYQHFANTDTNCVQFAVPVGATDCTITGTVIINPTVTEGTIIGESISGSNWIGIYQSGDTGDVNRVTGSIPILTIDGTTVPANRNELWNLLKDGKPHTFEITGADLDTADWSNFAFFRYDGSGFDGDGIIYNVELDLTSDGTVDHAWSGIGSNPWDDTEGSVDGTLPGVTDAVLVPESTTAGIDVLGNAIDPATNRTNNKVVNIFDASVWVQLPTDASLETIWSITLAFYNDGSTKDVLQAALGASFVDIDGDTLQTDQTGTTAFYVNGSGATTTLAAGWNIVTLVYDAGKDLSGGKILATSGNLLAYDPTALTADDALQNYNAFKTSYGL